MIATYKRSGPASGVGGAVLTVMPGSLPDIAPEAPPIPGGVLASRVPEPTLIVDTGQHMVVLGARCSVGRARADQRDPEWAARNRADRPIVERKIAHLVRRAWGGRKARTRGRARVATDVDTRAGAVNLARLATLGLAFVDGRWTVATG